jgi:hypothetical protein
VPHPKAHGIFILYGITVDEAQLAISNSRSVLQEQDEYQVPSTVNKMISKQKGRTPLTSYLKLLKIK